MSRIEFTKMHGLGNDYIYIDADRFPIADPAAFSIKWSRQHTGIGSDGLILISRSDVADFRMRIFNADGSEAMMCGNGIRCVAKFVYDKGLTHKTTISIDTLSGIKVITLRIEDGECKGATVDMGVPVLDKPAQFDVREAVKVDDNVFTVGGYDGTFVSMGNPHFVIFVPDVEDMDIAAEGRALEFHPAFPERCNIEFATVRHDGTIRMRVWERGSGITMACGTGACATAVAAAVTGRRGRASNIEMDGGVLAVEWRDTDNHVYMTGSAETAFEGIVEE